jgi:hypothetical protein
MVFAVGEAHQQFEPRVYACTTNGRFAKQPYALAARQAHMSLSREIFNVHHPCSVSGAYTALPCKKTPLFRCITQRALAMLHVERHDPRQLGQSKPVECSLETPRNIHR